MCDLQLQDMPHARLRLIDPLAYTEMLSLVESAGLVITDSGGLQEETTFLGVPCITVRPNTERPITCEQGTNRLAPRAAAGGEAIEERRRWIDGAVQEVEAAVRGAVEVAVAALHADTCAVYLLSADDQRLLRRECRAAADTIAAELPAGEGALGGAVRRASPVRLHGDIKVASYHLDGRRPGALLAVPLIDRRGGHVRGVVVADRAAPRPFGDDDERVLVTVAAEILRAVASERIMGDLRQTRDEAERVYQAMERLNRVTKLEEVIEVSIAVAGGLVDGLTFGAVTLVEGAGEAARHRVHRTWSAGAGKAPALEGLTFGDEAGSLVASAVRLGASLPGRELDVGKAVVFARRDVSVGDTREWLADASVRDVPHPGERIPAGRAVCTVFAAGREAASCHAALARRAERVYAELDVWERGVS